MEDDPTTWTVFCLCPFLSLRSRRVHVSALVQVRVHEVAQHLYLLAIPRNIWRYYEACNLYLKISVLPSLGILQTAGMGLMILCRHHRGFSVNFELYLRIFTLLDRV